MYGNGRSRFGHERAESHVQPPEWYLTEEQLELLERLKQICEETIRPLAAENDRTLTFPRLSLEALAPDGFLGLMLPKEWGGLGQNHVMYANEPRRSRATGTHRAPCATSMHIGAVEALKLHVHRVHDREVPEEGARRPHRDALVLRPRDRLALLVPDSVRRAPCRRRLRGAEEGVLDDVGRIRRLLRPPDHVARLRRRLLEPVGVRGRRATRSRRSPASGTRMGLRGTSPARSCSTGSSSPRAAGAARSATAQTRTTSRSTRTS